MALTRTGRKMRGSDGCRCFVDVVLGCLRVDWLMQASVALSKQTLFAVGQLVSEANLGGMTVDKEVVTV
jgi:hypothetical protein